DRAPTVTPTLSSTTVTPGQTVIITISASDPDGTIATTTVNWGDGTTDTIPGPPTTDSHAYSLANGTPSATFTITVTVHDNSGSTSSATPGITVIDSPPAITWTPPPATAVSGQAVTVAITSSDPDGTVTGVTVNWGDGKVDTLTHARLKIDLEAVKAEAGRIENQEFFQSVKDQLKKDKE